MRACQRGTEGGFGRSPGRCERIAFVRATHLAAARLAVREHGAVVAVEEATHDLVHLAGLVHLLGRGVGAEHAIEGEPHRRVVRRGRRRLVLRRGWRGRRAVGRRELLPVLGRPFQGRRRRRRKGRRARDARGELASDARGRFVRRVRRFVAEHDLLIADDAHGLRAAALELVQRHRTLTHEHAHVLRLVRLLRCHHRHPSIWRAFLLRRRVLGGVVVVVLGGDRVTSSEHAHALCERNGRKARARCRQRWGFV